MENATKAMLIAAGVLIGVMIISLGVALFAELDTYVQSSQEQIRFNEQNSFNTKFTKYIRDDLTIQDIITVANLANENNNSYNATETERGNQGALYVTVYLETEDDPREPIESNIQERMVELLTVNKEKTYKCEDTDVKYSEKTGRIYEIYFKEN